MSTTRYARPFDPWPLAAAFSKSMAEPTEPNRKRWARLYAAYMEASAKAQRRPNAHEPFAQLSAAEECLRIRPAIEAGDGGAVLDALARCAENGLVIPAWLADEYLGRHGAVGRGEARDWSDALAFGPAHPKGTNIAGVRAFVRHAGPAYTTAAMLLAEDPDRPIDRALYEEVGGRLGIGQTKVQELIADYLRELDGHLPPLTYLKSRLKAGRTLPEARADRFQEQWDTWLRDQNYAPGLDGVWSRPPVPES